MHVEQEEQLQRQKIQEQQLSVVSHQIELPAANEQVQTVPNETLQNEVQGEGIVTQVSGFPDARPHQFVETTSGHIPFNGEVEISHTEPQQQQSGDGSIPVYMTMQTTSEGQPGQTRLVPFTVVSKPPGPQLSHDSGQVSTLQQ